MKTSKRYKKICLVSIFFILGLVILSTRAYASHDNNQSGTMGNGENFQPGIEEIQENSQPSTMGDVELAQPDNAEDEENYQQPYNTYIQLDYTSFQENLRTKQISEINVYTDGQVNGKFTDGRLFNCTVPDYKQVMEEAASLGISVKMVKSWWSGASFFITIFSVAFILLFIISRFKRTYDYSGGKTYGARSTPYGYSNYGKNEYHSANNSEEEKNGSSQITFEDIAGIEEVMVEIREIVDYIKNPKVYNDMGITTPKGVLLAGPPGVGKTLIARAIASEAGANFIFASASEFDERYVGVGASRIRSMFTKAKADRPAIIFIDEIDTIGYKRYQSVNNSYEQTLNQLLTELDGFEKNLGIVVIAATNRIDVLDEALLRPGRFDRHIVINKPDLDARLKILQVHSRNKKLSPEALEGLPHIAAQTFGFSGADLANLLNEAGFHAIRQGKNIIEQSDIENALERIMGGISRKSTINIREKNIVAHHEAGHALAAFLLSEENPVTKISIVSRGGALGYVSQLPKEDTYILTEREARNRIKIMLAGRVAEELVYNEISTGAQNDLEQANGLARSMVCEFGMGPRLKNITWNNSSIYQQIPEVVSGDIKEIIDECYKEIRDILKQNYTKLIILSETLLTKEVLTGEELERIVTGKFGEQKSRAGRNQGGIGVAINGLSIRRREQDELRL